MAISFLVLACALAAEPAAEQRPLHEVQQELSQLLKSESQARTPQARAEAVRKMCALHSQIVRDPRFATSDVLKQYRGQLWSRLTKVKATLKQQIGRDADEAANMQHV